MSALTSVFEKLKSIPRSSVSIYPIVLMIAIPVLLIVSTVWNLNSFSRDTNFIIRHQAVSLTETLKPLIVSSLTKNEDTSGLLKSMVTENEDIISASILVKDGNEFKIQSSSSSATTVEEVSQDALNRFAESMNQAFAGLSYDPKVLQNVWVVTVPLEANLDKPYILALKMSTTTVDEILSRTSRDSFIILSVLIVITLALLANHFFFYRKAMRAQQIEEVDRLKDEFISIASHELRTPITAVVGYLDLLRDKIPAEIRPTLENEFVTLKGLTNDLNDLIEDLLEVSRIEQGRMKMSPENTKPGELITEVIKKLEPLAKQKALALSYTAVALPEIYADPHRINQVLTNLINNAIKYSLKGTITVATRVTGSQIEISVKDTGIGIPAEELSKLFGKFYRIKDEKTQDVRGTGLGLWITKQLVEALGGKISVESIYGSGSSFSFTLPITTARPSGSSGSGTSGSTTV